MNVALFLVSVSLALVGPVLALQYLRPILLRVLGRLCDGEGSAEFWIRSALLLAVSGTMLLMLAFGLWGAADSVIESMQRALLLVMVGVFVSVALIANQVWRQLQPWIFPQAAPAVPAGPRPASPVTSTPLPTGSGR